MISRARREAADSEPAPATEMRETFPLLIALPGTAETENGVCVGSGALVGVAAGGEVGIAVGGGGVAVGAIVGTAVGATVGAKVGTNVGTAVGVAVGTGVGITGAGVGVVIVGEGMGVGVRVGVEVAVTVGAGEAVAVGAAAHWLRACCTAAFELTNLPVVVLPLNAAIGDPLERIMFFNVFAENEVAHAELASAATPATCGLAIEVPLYVA